MNRHELFRYLISFIYPNRCPRCYGFIGYNDGFCADCREKIIVYDDGLSIDGADFTAAYCIYNSIVSPLLIKLKSDPIGNAPYAFALGIKEAIEKRGFMEIPEAIVPIPLTKEKYKERGYNQTELIARELSRLIGLPVERALLKPNETKQQKFLRGKERLKNLSGAFIVRDKFPVSGRSFLIIDDICTTGQTLSEAAKTLKAAGAGRICAAAFAKTHYTQDRRLSVPLVLQDH